MSECGIYSITNIIDGKIYIGQTSNLKRRKYEHFYCLKKNKHRNSRLQRAYNKYGEENFIFNILEVCNREELDDREDYYMKKYNSMQKGVGYNLMGVEFKHYTHSKETRIKISESNKGKKLSLEARQKLSESKKGSKMPREAIEKMRITKIGKFKGEENVCSKISNTEAEEILKFLYSNQELSIKNVAIKFNTTYDVVYNLKENRSYKDVLPHLREKIKELYKFKNGSAKSRLKNGNIVNITDKVLKALELVEQGYSQNEVSKKLNISRNTIRKALKMKQENTEITNKTKELLVL